MEIMFQTGTSNTTSSFSCLRKSPQKDPESQIDFCESNMIKREKKNMQRKYSYSTGEKYKSLERKTPASA